MKSKLVNLIVFLTVLPVISGFNLINEPPPANLPEQFASYWYNNSAELSSYQLEQARYGEIHEGTSMLIFVTEDFSKSKLVKLDDPTLNPSDAIPVFKMHQVKEFVTGVYPYSILQTVFSPLEEFGKEHALKITTSTQEWCGATFTQIKDTGSYLDIILHSYFEKEGDQKMTVDKNWMEDEIWNTIRISPNSLPQGTIKILPSTIVSRLLHQEFKLHEAKAKLKPHPDNSKLMQYSLYYPDLERTLIIDFQTEFPHVIEGWEESYYSGEKDKGQRLVSRAKRMRTVNVDYWNKNKIKDKSIRQDLGLD